MLNKNTLGVKKVRGQSEAALQTGATKNFDIIKKGGQVTKPIIVVKICYKLLYVIQVVKKILISNFLASTDIKVFGRTCLQCYFWLASHFFLHPRCFCLA